MKLPMILLRKMKRHFHSRCPILENADAAMLPFFGDPAEFYYLTIEPVSILLIFLTAIR